MCYLFDVWSRVCWKNNKREGNKTSGFHNQYLRRIRKMFWPKVTETTAATDLIKHRPRWRWIRRILRKESTNDARIAFTWQPPKRRKRDMEKDGGKRHGEGWWRRSEINLVEGVGGKMHKWRGREQNGGTWSVPYAALGAKRNSDE